MILHPPGDTAIVTDFGGLHVGVGVARQDGCAGRQRLDLVEVHRHGIERRGLAGKHRMAVSRCREGDAPPNPDFAALRIGADRAAGRDRDELQAPAASEQRRTACHDGAGKLDLPLDRRTAIIDVQRRARDRDAVIAVKVAARQVGAGIGRIADVDRGAGQQMAQQCRIALAQNGSAGLHVLGAGLGGIAFDDQQARGHGGSVGGVFLHNSNTGRREA